MHLAHSLTRTRARMQGRARTDRNTHARMHARARTHTHTCALPHTQVPEMNYQAIRNMLGKFGLPGDKAVQKIETLSGGQKVAMQRNTLHAS